MTRIVTLRSLVTLSLFSLAVASGTVRADAKDDLRLYTQFNGQVEFWKITNTSTNKAVKATLRYSQTCTGPASVWTKSILVEPGELKQLEPKKGQGTCGDLYISVSGAYYP